MRVWLSRTQPGADRQAEELRAAGFEPLVLPVLEARALTADPPPGPFDRVLFLSEHAVRFGRPRLELAGAQVLAVGQQTAALLAAAGVAAQVPEPPTSEGLLALPALTGLEHARVLLVCGADGRGLLAETLAERGARVLRLVCYRRVPAALSSSEFLGVDAIVAGSGDGLRQVARHWFAAGGRADVPVLVPSARVAALGVELGFGRLHDCGGAGTPALLAGLEQLQATGAR